MSTPVNGMMQATDGVTEGARGNKFSCISHAGPEAIVSAALDHMFSARTLGANQVRPAGLINCGALHHGQARHGGPRRCSPAPHAGLSLNRAAQGQRRWISL
jgi:hypothetical protein